MNAISSAKNVPFGVSRPAGGEPSTMVTNPYFAVGDDVDEEEAEREVDEVHPFDQSDDQEHGHLQPALRLWLTGGSGDGRVTGETVTDGGADRATAERKSGGDQRSHHDAAHGSCGLSPQLVACDCGRRDAPPSRPSRAMPK